MAALMLLTMILPWKAVADDYRLVTNISQLSQGDVILIVNTKTNGSAYALGTTQNTNNRKAESVSINDNIISTLGNAQEITLESKNAAGNFTLKVGATSYLYAANTSSSNKKNYLKSKNDNSVYWEITINTTSHVAAVSDVTSTCYGRDDMKYNANNNNPIFSCYDGGDENLFIFKKQTSYTITAQSNNPAYGTVSVSGSTITATPSSGYRIKAGTAGYTVISGTATVTNNGDNTFTVTTSEDCTVQINFEAIPSHTLSYVVSPEDAGTVALDATSVLEGATTTATATANAGYKFTGWSITGGGATVSNTTDNPVTVTMGNANATITATFEAVTTYEINWSVNGSIVKTENVEESTAITFAAPTSGIPAGYTFKGWVVAANRIAGITNTEPSANYVTSGTSTADITYYAVMAIENGTTDRTVTLTANSSWSGYTDKSFTDNEGNTWTAHCSGSNVSGVYYYGLNTPTNTNYFKSPNFGGNITAINVIATNGSGKDDRYYYISSDNTGSGDYGSITVPKSSTGESFDAVLGGTSFTEFYLGVSGALQFHEISVVYAKTNYTAFCTTILPISGHENISEGKLTTANVTLSSGAYYLDETITIEENKILTVSSTGALANTTAANLIIENGGQLICRNDVAATLQKSITHYTSASSKDGWYTIASPVVGTDMSLSAIGDYDLFKYDETSHTWLNEYNHEDDFTSTSVAEGFLYANGANQTLPFAGEMKASNAEVTKALTYSSTDGKLKGFNLVGNPFTCNLTSSMVKMNGETLSTYYVSEGHANLKVRTLASTPIKPGQGFFVQAPSACDLVFNPSSKDEMDYKPTFISIEAGNSEFTDMAYIQLGYGNTLRKMSINDNTPLVYVMNEGADYAAATVDELKGSMPICFKAASTGQYTISVNTEGLDMSYLHLIDRFTGEDVNLLLEPTYSFIATKGDNESRFILSFTANCFNDSESETFAYQAGNDIFVSGEGELQIFDVTGRMVSTTYVNGIETIKLPSSGMYIFRLVGTEVKTQKIVVR